MPIKIPSLPSIPNGTITGKTSIPVSKTDTDPKTYRATLDQVLTWVQANGGGGGGAGSQGAQGGLGAQGIIGSQGVQGGFGSSGYQGVQGSVGAQGTTGTPGSATGLPGEDARGLQLVASSYVFQASSSPTVSSLTATPYSPTAIYFTAVPQNLTGTATFVGKLYNINNAFTGSASFSGTGNTVALTNTQFGSAYTCTVTASIVSGSNTYYDITTVTRLRDSTDVLQGYLSNPVAVLAASQDGQLGNNELDKAIGIFEVYYGLTKLSTGVVYSVVSEGATSVITTGQSSAVNFDIDTNTGIYTLTSINNNVIGASAILRAQAYGLTIDKPFTVAKALQGVTGPAGSAQAVFMTADTQVFAFDSTGTPTPSAQLATFNAVLSNLTGIVQWTGVQYYTDGTNATATSLLSTNGNYAYLTITNFASAASVGKEVSSFTVSATHVASGLSDAVRVVKVIAGGQGYTSFLTNQSHTVGADSTGAVFSLSGANGYFRIYQGAVPLNNQYVTYGIKEQTTGLGSYILNYPSNSAGYYALTAFDSSLTNGSVVLTAAYLPTGATSAVPFEQTFSVAKSKNGPTGDTGPGIVYRGIYNTGTSYFRTATRADAVFYSSNYYLAASSGLGSVLGTPGVSPGWQSFGAQFSSVATGLLLAEDATILRTLVMGYETGVPIDRGVIRSYGVSDWNPHVSSQDGFWMGMDQDDYAKFRIGSVSNNLVWDGTTLTQSYGNSGITFYGGSSGTDTYMGIGTTTYNSTGIWLGRVGSATSGTYRLSLKSNNGRSLTWDGSNLTTNGATQNLATSGTIYLNKTGPNDDVNTGFWLGVSASNAYFSVGSQDSWLKYNDSTNTVSIKGVEATDAVIITSPIGLRYTNDNGVFTITGGSDNGADNGAQIDLAGSNSGSVKGALVIQAGDPAKLYSGSTSAANIYFRTGPCGTGALSATNKLRAIMRYNGEFAIAPNEGDPASLSLSGNDVGSNSFGNRTVQNGGSPSGGQDGDIIYIY